MICKGSEELAQEYYYMTNATDIGLPVLLRHDDFDWATYCVGHGPWSESCWAEQVMELSVFSIFLFFKNIFYKNIFLVSHFTVLYPAGGGAGHPGTAGPLPPPCRAVGTYI